VTMDETADDIYNAAQATLRWQHVRFAEGAGLILLF
jgi:hypothetical protein